MRFKSPLFAIGWLALVITALILLLKLWNQSASAPIETDILKLLPQDKQNPVAEQAFSHMADSMGKQVVFVVANQDASSAFLASRQLAEKLQQSGYFHQVIGEIDANAQQQWANYYFTHRFQFLTAQQRQRLSEQPQQQVQYVLQSLYNPFSGVTGTELANDPFLLFRDYLNELSQRAGTFKVRDGFLTLEKDHTTYVLLSAQLADSPYSLDAQRAVAQISQWQQQLAAQTGSEFYHTGVLFYADFGTQSAKQEISTIGMASLAGIVLLMLWVFRSATPLLLALLSITIGLLVAFCVTLWLFGKVHLFSLVFGASLIGVSIDYAFHYLTDRLAAGRKWHSISGLQHIFAAITLGLITSLIGYLGLLIAPFPGLQQLALFSATGLLAAYLTVVAWYPWLAARPSKERSLPGLALWQAWLACWQQKRVAVYLPAAIALASLLAVTQIRYDDDIRQLQALPPQLKSQESVIAQLTGVHASQQMLLVRAENNEKLLQRLESLEPTLANWQHQGIISAHQSLAQTIHSVAQQQQDYQLIKALYQGFSSSLSQNLGLKQVASFDAAFNPVFLQDYLQSPVSEPVRFMYLGLIDEKVSAAILLKEVSDSSVIKRFAEQDAEILYLNKTEDISQLFSQYRVKVMELIGAALLVIFSLLSWRYGVRHSVRIVLPCLIACLAGLAVSVFTGSTLNLFNLLALVLVIGIGIDYTLFFAEQQASHSTLLAVTLSAITTLLSFGLLALSATHAIHSFGLTVLSGIFIAWLLAPMAIDNKGKSS